MKGDDNSCQMNRKWQVTMVMWTLLAYSPYAQKNTGGWTGTLKFPLGVNMCSWCPQGIPSRVYSCLAPSVPTNTKEIKSCYTYLLICLYFIKAVNDECYQESKLASSHSELQR